MGKFNTVESVENNTNIKSIAGNAIILRLQPKFSRSYGISIKYFDDSQPEPIKDINYQIHLFIEQYKNLDHTWQLSFNKDELFINRHEPDLIGEQLAYSAMKALYPVKVDVNDRNEIFRGIVNHSEIVEKWEGMVKKIQEKYIGPYTALFIEKMNKKMQNKWEIEQSLEYDMFWKAFFHPQYFSYGQDLTKETIFEFPVLPYQNIKFAGKQVLKENYTDYATYSVGFNAEMELPDHIKDKKQRNQKAKMKLNAQFDLDQNGGLLKYAIVNWGIYQPNNEQEGNCSKRIQFSAYEIDNKNKVITKDQKVVVSDQQNSTAPKKGFWERILG